MAKVNSFEELEVWQRAINLCELIYKQTNISALNKDFSLRDQIRRSAISISSNIAEGFERESTNQVLYFLIIAKGSCGELRTQLYLANKIGYLENEIHENLKQQCFTISKQLGSFIKYLRSIKHQKSSKLSEPTQPYKLKKPPQPTKPSKPI
jgi:four helix bundle protein